MEIAKANLVQATAGREKGKTFFVLETDGEYLLLADGKSRRAEAPKRKKRKHVSFLEQGGGRVAEKILANEKVTNSELRKAIAAAAGSAEAESGDQAAPPEGSGTAMKTNSDREG